MKRFLCLAMACGASACGGGSNGVPLTDVPVASDLVGLTADSVTFSEVFDTYRVEVPSALVAGIGDVLLLPGNPVFDFRSFDVAEDGTGNAIFVAETDNAQVVLSLLDNSATGVRFSRTEPGGIPESGTAQFDGDYVALVQTASGDDILLIVNGDAQFDVDFGSGDISGTISNRTARSTEGNVLLETVGRDDLTFTAGALMADGSFFGDAEGGNLNLSSLSGGELTTTSFGSFQGLVAGVAGEDVVGAASIFHNAGGAGDFFEEGAFIASD